MKTLAFLALCAATSSTFLVPQQQQDVITNDQSILEPETYLIDLGAGDTRWVTEDEKWELKRANLSSQTSPGGKAD
jgi:bacterial leucyl aminopeptidase